MGNARVVVVQHPQHIATGKGHVARIKQQGHGGMLHEKVKLGFGLNRRRHVVVIADRHPVRRTPVGKIADLAAIDIEDQGEFLAIEGDHSSSLAGRCARSNVTGMHQCEIDGFVTR